MRRTTSWSDLEDDSVMLDSRVLQNVVNIVLPRMSLLLCSDYMLCHLSRNSTKPSCLTLLVKFSMFRVIVLSAAILDVFPVFDFTAKADKTLLRCFAKNLFSIGHIVQLLFFAGVQDDMISLYRAVCT